MTQHSQHPVCDKSQNKIDNYTCSGRNNEVKLEFTLLDFYFVYGNMSTRLMLSCQFSWCKPCYSKFLSHSTYVFTIINMLFEKFKQPYACSGISEHEFEVKSLIESRYKNP